MQIRRCSILLIEPREKLGFNLESLFNGGDGLQASIELLALAPHLDAEVAVSQDETAILNSLTASPWHDFEALTKTFDASILASLVAKGLLISDDVAHAKIRERDDKLRAANWHAHSAVSHYFGRWRGITSGEDAVNAGLCTMSELFERLGAPPPHNLDRVPAEERKRLPLQPPTSLDELLARRATCRNFDDTKFVDKSTFSLLMQRVFGAQAEYEIHDKNVVIKRTSPSGGGLHPTEAYLLVQRVEGIEPGLYHYHTVDHALEPLPPPVGGDLRAFARMMVAAQQHYINAPVLIVLVSRFPRTFWKYRNHTKAYRATILDAGHLSQTLYISATELGLGAFITAAINEVEIEQAFGLDALAESPLAVCGFGVRAAECATFEFDPNHAVWPDGVPDPD